MEGQRGKHLRPAVLVDGQDRLAELVEAVHELGPTGRDGVAELLEREPAGEGPVELDLRPFLEKPKSSLDTLAVGRNWILPSIQIRHQNIYQSIWAPREAILEC